MGTYAEGSAGIARKLRAQMTDAERRLWAILRNRGVGGHKFIRQLPVGPFVADFACRERNLVIEVDGGQHAGSLADEKRTAELERHGYRVIRFWNNDVLTNPEGVYETISRELATRPSAMRFEASTKGAPRARVEE